MHLRSDGGLLEGFLSSTFLDLWIEYGLGLINTADRSSSVESAKLASSAKCEVLFLLIEALFGTSFIEAEEQVVTRYFFN